MGLLMDRQQKEHKSGGGRKTVKEEISESLTRVDIEGLGPVFVDGNPATVKNGLRKMFKKPEFIKSVERATEVDARKYFRGMAAGKKDDAVEESVSEGECWDTHKKVGTKMKNGKRVNDCVPKNEVANPLDGYPEQGKMKVKLVTKEDQVSRDRESEMLKVKHHREREAEKRTTDRMKKRTTKVTSPTRSEQIIAKHEEDVVAEQLSALDKRKYSNLKKRAKSGDRTAKKQLDAFEKEKSSEIAMSKGSAGRAKRSTVKSKKGVGDIHTGQGYTGRSSEAGSDDHIIMQLRKAQDVNGNMDIKVSPTGKKVKLPKSMIDKLLKMHDRMSKPDEKRKLRILITKELRKKAK